MKKLSVYLILLIILLLSTGAIAQKEIKGIITDHENQKAYADFYIGIKNSTLKTKTNSFGYFKFILADTLNKFQFDISPGYVIHSQEINKKGNYHIQIAPISTEELHVLPLEDILNIPVISALKHEEKVENIPASVEVITREEINRMGYLNLQEILNTITGFYTWDDYHVRGRINVGLRGSMSSDNIIILVNGVNQIENMYNEYLLPKVGVPVEAIERIEIIKGPMSVQYGSGAFFGVINIITETPQKGGSTRFSGLLGAQGSEAGVIDYHQKQKDFSLAATIHGFKADGMERPYSSMMSDASKLSNYGLPLDASTKGILHEERAYMHLSTTYKGFEADFAHTFVERGGFLVQPPVSYSPMNRSSTNAMFSYKKEFSDKFWIQPRFSFLSTNSFATYFLKEEESFFTFGYNSEAIESEIFAYLKLGESLELTSDISFNSVFYALNPAELEAAWGKPFGHHITRLAIHSSINTYAAFAQASYRINEHWRILAGVRFEQMSQFMMESAGGDLLLSQGRIFYESPYDNNKPYFIPRGALIYSWNKQRQILKLLYGEALRHPPLGIMADMLYYTSDGAEFNLPKLMAANIRTLELNYLGNFGKHVQINASVFQNNLKNLISQYIFTDPADSSSLYFTGNVGKIKTLGAELRLDFNINKKLKSSISGIYQQSENLEKGYENIAIAYSPSLLLYFKQFWQINKYLSFALNANYVDKMLPEYNKVSNNRIGKETAAFYLLNAQLGIQNLPLKQIQWSFKVTNLLNADVHYPATTLNTFADLGLLGNPRMFFVKLCYTVLSE